MSLLPLGSFVWCRFPLSEYPNMPGPENHLHLVYIEDESKNSVLTIYTTSVTWDPSVPIPIGVIVVDASRAKLLSQKPFVLDARRIALLPATKDWFPGIDDPNHGVLLIADKLFQKEVTRISREALSRPYNIELLGPSARQNTQEWKPHRH